MAKLEDLAQALIESRSKKDEYAGVDDTIRNIAASRDSEGRWLVLWAQYPNAPNHARQVRFGSDVKNALLGLTNNPRKGAKIDGARDVVFWFEHRPLTRKDGGPEPEPSKTMPGYPELGERMEVAYRKETLRKGLRR